MTRAGDAVTDLGKDKAGRRWWQLRLYWVDKLTGKPRETKRKVQAPGKAAALAMRETLLDELRAGKRDRERFHVACSKWVEASRTHSTKKTRESLERTLNARFKDAWMDAITARILHDYLHSLDMQHDSANNVRNALVGIFQLAVERGVLEMNVAKSVSRLKPRAKPADEDEEPEEVARALTPEQLAAYLDDLEQNEPDLYPLVHTQFVIGCRFAEVSALRKERVDMATGIVKLRQGQFRGIAGRTKGKRARKVALPMEARAVLKAHLDRMSVEQPRGWEELCFPRPETGRPRPSNYWASSSIDKAIRRSFKRCGIVVKGATHVARHTHVTFAQSLPINEALFREVVGHRSKSAHARYVHPTDAQVIDIGNAVGREMLRARARKGRE